jgi:orotidine-5'-phosphate decarboxylase
MTKTMKRAQDQLFVALDVPDVATARDLVTTLGDNVSCYKIGLELLFGGGLEFGRQLKSDNKTVFLDMKLLDIGATVEKATANIARLGFDYLTVHGSDTKQILLSRVSPDYPHATLSSVALNWRRRPGSTGSSLRAKRLKLCARQLVLSS